MRSHLGRNQARLILAVYDDPTTAHQNREIKTPIATAPLNPNSFFLLPLYLSRIERRRRPPPSRLPPPLPPKAAGVAAGPQRRCARRPAPIGGARGGRPHRRRAWPAAPTGGASPPSGGQPGSRRRGPDPARERRRRDGSDRRWPSSGGRRLLRWAKTAARFLVWRAKMAGAAPPLRPQLAPLLSDSTAAQMPSSRTWLLDFCRGRRCRPHESGCPLSAASAPTPASATSRSRRKHPLASTSRSTSKRCSVLAPPSHAQRDLFLLTIVDLVSI